MRTSSKAKEIPMTEPDPILVSVDDNIATIQMNRPEVMNALSTPLVTALRDALADLRRNKDVRALVLTGSGRAFSAGADLNDPIMSLDAPREERGQRFRTVMDTQINAMMRDLYSFDRPKIAAVNGAAAGGGVGLALTMDIVIASKSAYFMQVFAPALNLVPDLGCTWHLAHQLGRARALGLAMTGERLVAEKAEEWGLIWRCVEDDELATTVRDLARKLAAGPTRALAATPAIIDAAQLSSFTAQLDMERDVQSALVQTSDFEEAVAAFLAKRKPEFTGL